MAVDAQALSVLPAEPQDIALFTHSDPVVCVGQPGNAFNLDIASTYPAGNSVDNEAQLVHLTRHIS